MLCTIKNMTKNQYFLTIISIIVLVVAFYFFYNFNDNSNSSDVALRVNGVEFDYPEFQREFDSVLNEYKSYGIQLDKEKIKESVINRLTEIAIVTEKMEELGIEASEKEIQTQISRAIAAMPGVEIGEELMDFLSEKGISKEEIYKAADYDVKFSKLVDYFSKDLKPTEEDLKEKYNSYLASMGDLETRSFEDMKEDLRNSIIEDFGLQKVFELIEENKKTATVEVLISDDDIVFEEVESKKVSKDFINCLKEKGVTIYTSSTCPACKSLVEKYGGYDVLSPIVVDCNEEQERCSKEMLEDFVPSVVINGESFKEVGTPENLARATGCELKFDN